MQLSSRYANARYPVNPGIFFQYSASISSKDPDK